MVAEASYIVKYHDSMVFVATLYFWTSITLFGVFTYKTLLNIMTVWPLQWYDIIFGLILFFLKFSHIASLNTLIIPMIVKPLWWYGIIF